MPPRKAAKVRNAATTTPRKTSTNQAQPAKKLCGCYEVPGTAGAKKFEKDGKHNLSRHEAADASPSSAFTTIKISDSIQGRIQQNELRLTTLKAVFDKDKVRNFNQQARQQQSGLAHQQKEEATREKEALKQQRLEEKVREQAAKAAREKAYFFLSFTYGGSVKDREAIGHSWVADQLIHPKSVRQTTADSRRLTSDTNTLVLASSQLLPNALNTDERTTRQTIHQRKAALLVPDYHSPDQLDFSPLTPNFAHGPTQPLTPADSFTFDIKRNTPLDPLQEDFEDMSNKPVYPESGGAAEAIKDVIQNLFTLQQHVHQFRPEQQDGVNRQVESVAKSLSTLDEVVTKPSNPLHNLRVAPEIIEYVDDARNPDIFSREFVELVQRGNSVLNGKQQAFRSFSQIYAKKLKESFEGLDDEVDLVMSNAGMEERNGKFVDKVRNGNAD